MRTAELLHYAFRARDPLALARWYAELFDGRFFLHPVMTPLGIYMVKVCHPEAVFVGLLEFWPWDIVWDGTAHVFRKVEPRPSPTSYGHMALKISATTDEIVADLKRRGIAYRMEPRALALAIPVIDDPEGNMIELFPNIDHISLPPEAICPPAALDQVLPMLKAQFDQRLAAKKPKDGVPLLMFEKS